MSYNDAMTTPSHTIKCPVRFYDDHRDRDLPSGVELSRTKRHVVVELSDVELIELRSDAVFYSDFVQQSGDSSYIGLQSSARATVAVIDKLLDESGRRVFDLKLSDDRIVSMIDVGPLPAAERYVDSVTSTVAVVAARIAGRSTWVTLP